MSLYYVDLVVDEANGERKERARVGKDDYANMCCARYVVCEYSPAGNVLGEFATQVLPPVKSGAARNTSIRVGLLVLLLCVSCLGVGGRTFAF